MPHQKAPTRAEDPDWWHRKPQSRPFAKIEYDPKCTVCGKRYREGTYSYHKKQPIHRAALAPKHKVKK